VVEFATAPLSPAQRAEVLPNGGAFTDKQPYLFTARFDGLGRLISAFPVSFLVRDKYAFYKEAKRRLAAYHPSLKQLEIDCLWEGRAWINKSFLPEIYDLGDDALAIQACNGRGLAINSSIGREMAAALMSGDFTALSVTPRTPTPIPFYAAAALAPKALMSVAYLKN
jgi:glycine/D-amino acid oxidase-like deaminating enzyme